MEFKATFNYLALFLVLSTKASLALGTCSNCTLCNSGEGQLNGLCKCDGNCGLFGDCCESPLDLNTCQSDTVVPTGVDFVCRSIYLDSRIKPLINESFWMVSSCPNSWSVDTASQVMVRDSCVSLSSSLPPITDLDTGTVYANEFCALCNRAKNLVAWQPNLVCSWYVYDQLEELSVQQLLQNDPTIFQTQCQACSYQVPAISSIPIPRPCFVAVSTCASRSHLEALTGSQYSVEMYDSLVDGCVNGPYDLVSEEPAEVFEHEVETYFETLFRNKLCAACNGWSSSYLFCFSPTTRTGVPLKCIPITEPPSIVPTTESTRPNTTATASQPNLNDTMIPDYIGDGSLGIPFTIALSNLGGGQVQVSVMTETVTVDVNCPDGQAVVGLDCRPTLCPEGYVESGGRCAFQINTLTNSSNGTVVCLTMLMALNTSDYIPLNNETVIYEDQILTVVEYEDVRPVVCPSNSSINCPSKFVTLNDSEFISLGNDTILFGDEVFEVITYDALGRPFICPPNDTSVMRNVTVFVYTYPEGYLILTYIGCSLSVIGSALLLLTYGIFKTLRKLPGLILMNLAVAIILNNLFILIGGPVTQAFPSVELCTAVAICLHFFFLAQFTWMSIMSFQMARTFYQARHLKFDSKRGKRKVFAVYLLLGWSIPVLITGTSIIVDFTTEHLVLYGVLEDGRLGSCWINHFESAIVAFLVPLILSMTINVVLFVVATVLICLAYRSSAKLEKSNNLPFFRINVAIFSVTGLTWIFGFIALLAGTSWAWYPFIIINSSQGFIIFMVFLFTKRVLELYWNLICCRKPFDSTRTRSTTGDQSKRVVTTPSQDLNHSPTAVKN